MVPLLRAPEVLAPSGELVRSLSLEKCVPTLQIPSSSLSFVLLAFGVGTAQAVAVSVTSVHMIAFSFF